MRARHKKWAEPYLEAHKEIIINNLDGLDSFLDCDNLYLEVGCGKGDFILGMSKKFPGNYIGIERDSNVAAMCCRKLVDDKIENVKLFYDDFDKVFEIIKDIKFNKVFLNFSDPWPKKKQHKRRLTSTSRLLQFATILKKNGLLVIKTDNDMLYEDTLEYAANVPYFEQILNLPEYEFNEDDDVMTEYEKNFRSQGKSIHKVIYKLKENANV